jgi:hypothetical protein
MGKSWLITKGTNACGGPGTATEWVITRFNLMLPDRLRALELLEGELGFISIRCSCHVTMPASALGPWLLAAGFCHKSPTVSELCPNLAENG